MPRNVQLAALAGSEPKQPVSGVLIGWYPVTWLGPHMQAILAIYTHPRGMRRGGAEFWESVQAPEGSTGLALDPQPSPVQGEDECEILLSFPSSSKTTLSTHLVSQDWECKGLSGSLGLLQLFLQQKLKNPSTNHDDDSEAEQALCMWVSL